MRPVSRRASSSEAATSGMEEPNGYHRLAAIMGAHPDLAIFRRFMALNAYNLLSLQAELSELESELNDIVIQDRTSKDPEKTRFEFSIYDLQGAHNNPDHGLQWRKFLEIREKLREYCLCPLN
jgi:hypothetical protein